MPNRRMILRTRCEIVRGSTMRTKSLKDALTNLAEEAGELAAAAARAVNKHRGEKIPRKGIFLCDVIEQQQDVNRVMAEVYRHLKS